MAEQFTILCDLSRGELMKLFMLTAALLATITLFGQEATEPLGLSCAR
jgi:hypothetical protein